MIMRALLEKATSVGTLTNFSKVSGLIDAVGDNLRTTFQTSEVRTLASIAQEFQTENVKSLAFIDDETGMMTTGMIGGMSIVQPTAGLYDYSEIRSYIRENLSSDPVTKEKATVAVYNGSGVAGAAQLAADRLEDNGLVVGEIANAPDGIYGRATIYQVTTSDKPATRERLQSLYGVQISEQTPPVTPVDGTAFVVIIGEGSEAATGN